MLAAMRWFVVAALALAGCEGGQKPMPDRSSLRQPTGVAVSPDGALLFVTGGNWDQAQAAGTMMTLDLARVDLGLARPRMVGASMTDARPCRRLDDTHTLECDPDRLIDPTRTVLLGDAVGNIEVDEPGGEGGALRLLISQRRPPAIAWVDVNQSSGSVSVDCGQDEEGTCDVDHLVTRVISNDSQGLPADPSRVVIDREFRLGYVPHLVDGAFSLLSLDGENGPELVQVQGEFFRPAFDEDLELAGAFSVARRGCDLDNPPDRSRDCMRPVLYSTNRYFPAVKPFSVAPGMEVVLDGTDANIAPIGVENVDSRPLMGDLEFEDDTGDTLLVVQTTPGGLARVDTSVDEDGRLANELKESVALCSNPNQMEIFRPEGGEPLALVTCFGDGRLAVVSLATFTVIQTVTVGEGANEITVDPTRGWAFVANTQEDTISVVDLDRTRSTYLTEHVRIGLGAGVRDED